MAGDFGMAGAPNPAPDQPAGLQQPRCQLEEWVWVEAWAKVEAVVWAATWDVAAVAEWAAAEG